MSDKLFYEKKLYPLQDEVLAIIDKNGSSFYLTGGTALNRFYNGCRYSDDLDFFTLKTPGNFRDETKNLLDELIHAGLKYKIDSFSGTFIRVTVVKDKTQLKVDFVNDPVFRWGKVKKFKEFNRVDNEMNILANKITAISRHEVKDIVDIWLICRQSSLKWREAFEIASRKSPVDPLDVFRIIKSMPESELKMIKWSKAIKIHDVYNDLQIIAENIVKGNQKGRRVRS